MLNPKIKVAHQSFFDDKGIPVFILDAVIDNHFVQFIESKLEGYPFYPLMVRSKNLQFQITPMKLWMLIPIRRHRKCSPIFLKQRLIMRTLLLKQNHWILLARSYL